MEATNQQLVQPMEALKYLKSATPRSPKEGLQRCKCLIPPDENSIPKLNRFTRYDKVPHASCDFPGCETPRKKFWHSQH